MMHNEAQSEQADSEQALPGSPREGQKKSVLVCVGERKRTVSWTVRDGEGDLDVLVEAVKAAYNDVYSPSPDEHLVLQIKSEDWNGEFVDLSSDAAIPDRSVLKVVQVSWYAQPSSKKCGQRCMHVAALHRC